MNLVSTGLDWIYQFANLRGAGFNFLFTLIFSNLLRINDMALVIGKKATRKFKATAVEPGDFLDARNHSFNVEWNVLPRQKADALRQLVKDDVNAANDAIFDELINVDEVNDEVGNSVPFSPQLVEALRSQSWIENAMIGTFWAVQNGLTQGEYYKALKLKN